MFRKVCVSSANLTQLRVKCAPKCNTKPFLSLPSAFDQSVRSHFVRGSPRDGYSKVDEEIEKMSRTEIIRTGIKTLKEELKLWKQEVKEKLEGDPILINRPGEIDIVFRFDSDEHRSRWVTTADSDHGQGHSQCSLTGTPHGTALFQGVISTQVPVDGRTKKAGYCNLTSMKKRKSFKRDATYQWDGYTHIVFKVRGDGRPYMLNLHCPGDYDIFWSDIYHYVLYTRGGPYWQLTKIPFSKFFLGAQGRVQDIQGALPLDRITRLGVTAADGVEGPFSLEIDYVGVEFDPSHTEEFAYEMYRTEGYMVKY